MQRKWAGPGEQREIVEIGAVRATLGGAHQDLKCFSTLVTPQVNPVLSDYFTALTGITQADVDQHGIAFNRMLETFLGFTDGADRIVSYGGDAEVIRENCLLTGTTPPLLLDQMEDIRPLITAAYDLSPKVSSNELPAAIGVGAAQDLRAHRALDDALAVSSVLIPLLENDLAAATR